MWTATFISLLEHLCRSRARHDHTPAFFAISCLLSVMCMQSVSQEHERCACQLHSAPVWLQDTTAHRCGSFTVWNRGIAVASSGKIHHMKVPPEYFHLCNGHNGRASPALPQLLWAWHQHLPAESTCFITASVLQRKTGGWSGPGHRGEMTVLTSSDARCLNERCLTHRQPWRSEFKITLPCWIFVSIFPNKALACDLQPLLFWHF